MRNELQKQPLEVFCKKGALKNFAKSTEKYLCQSLFFNKHCTKTIFSFSRRRAAIWSFWYYWERSCFFFPKIWSSTLDRKWKMILLKKIHGNMIFSSNVLKRWSFQKGLRRDMIFLVLSGKMVFFSRKHIFSLGRKSGMNFLKKYIHGNMIFFCVHVCVLQIWRHAPLPKKIKGGLIP